MLNDESLLTKLLRPFYKSIFRTAYMIFLTFIPVAILFILLNYLPFPFKTKKIIEIVFLIIGAGLFILGWYRSNLAIYYFEKNKSFRQAHYQSGQDIKFKCSYLPLIGFLFRNKE